MKESDASVILEFEKIRAELKQIVYDQDDAIDEVVDDLIHMTYRPVETPPKAVFTFLGPPDVGKIYLAQSLAVLLDQFETFKEFDMGQYAAAEDVDKLLGQKISPEGIQEGELTKFIKKHPAAVILFDKIENADNQVQLALLDRITRTDLEGGVDFSEALIIFTSSLGGAFYQNREFLDTFKKNKLRAQAVMMDAVSKEKKLIYDIIDSAIEPKLLALMSRNYIVIFNKLGMDSMVRIGRESLKRFSKHFMNKIKIELEYQDPEQLVKILTLSFSPYINAERIRQKLPDELLYKVTQFVRANQTIPNKVIYQLSEQAKSFLDGLYKESRTLTRKLFRKNQTVEFVWKEHQYGETVVFTLDEAELKKLPTTKLLFREERPRVEFSAVGFNDIAGNKTIKKTLKQIINILKDPNLVKRFDIDMPKGMLLYGPTGVGKTMLAKAFAKEAELPYIYVSGSDLFDSDYIRRAYHKAKEFAPSIVFLDEVDIKGIIEGVYANMPSDPLAMELDALSSHPFEFVFTIATAKNREEVDPAIIAPGRIDTFVEVPELDREARRFFIEKILEKPNDGKIDVDKVVRYISGMSGYELKRIGKEASLYAIRQNLEFITEEILIEQINNIKYGYKLEKKHFRNLEEELKKTAFHEAGHAVISYILLPDIKIEQVTIAPRLETQGFVSYTAEDFPGNVSKEEIFNNICVMLAGRIANIKKFGPKGIDTGAANDLEQATYQAYLAITSLGMDDELGYVHLDTLYRNINKQLFQEKVENRIIKWIADAKEKAEKLVNQYWSKIESVSQLLLQKEIVDGSELEEIMKGDGRSKEPVK
ncbi:MAG: AAA family ATPase [Desulfobacterales bacterium]|nr:AAA family ATPase [Desulfobacterales bacterium]